jgi:16S rRNA (cytosine1402-N4)-methyltransferase
MHQPVLLKEVIEFTRAIHPHSILDGTFGRGGHTRALLEACPDAVMWAIDQDEDAILYGRAEFSSEINKERLSLKHFNFHNVERLAGRPMEGFDVILLDLGVSSPQLDQGDRGFSFYHEGPLDMRMDRNLEMSAADVINTWPEVELNNLFIRYGEIRRPQRVVKAIVQDRKQKKFMSTRELAGLIERIEGWKRKGHHPATTYFLALRMVVNNELAGLQASVPGLLRALSPAGRLLVITFHSLEDRIIKYAFKEASPELGVPLFKKVIVPSREEQKRNPRARSAKLRIFQRGVHHDPAAIT